MIRHLSDQTLLFELDGICRDAFCTSLLLTGSVSYAEAVVVKAVEQWTPDDAAEGALMRYVIDRSLEAGEPAEIESAAQIVSEELRPVLRLSGVRRHCFVLRILGNISKQACACILGLNIYEVECYTTSALVLLAELRRQQPSAIAQTVRAEMSNATVCEPGIMDPGL